MIRVVWACAAVAALTVGLAQASNAPAESTCFGTVSRGRVEGGVKLPASGDNFSAYSDLAAATGRTHVHSTVAAIVVDAYARLATTRPATRYVYGETGWPSGGSFKPHKTHQNGLSVDFFVPVLNTSGHSVPLPTHVANRFGYDIEFDAKGRFGEYTIDFEAAAEHLYELEQAARQRGSGVALVIFDTAYLPTLFATRRGPQLKQTLPFMKGKPWVRHDEHYHVDFKVACKAFKP